MGLHIVVYVNDDVYPDMDLDDLLSLVGMALIGGIDYVESLQP